MKLILSAFLLISIVFSQSCMNARGSAVAWWIIMKVPPKIGKIGYAYYDSTLKTGKFVYVDAKVD